jgi:hypothetical protein
MNTTPTRPLRSDATLLLALTTMLLWVSAASVTGQGTLDFCTLNQGDGIDAPVRETQGNPLGDQYYGQLYAGVSAVALAPVGTPVAFRKLPGTSNGSGYIVAGLVVLPGVVPGMNVYFQLRAWESNGGASYESALAAGKKTGKSEIVQSPPTGGGLMPPPPLVGLQGFSLEPSPNTRPTVANPIADFAVNENAPDTVIDLRAVFQDAETTGANLVYSIQANSNPPLLSATAGNTTDGLTLHYQANQHGSATIIVRATDAGGLFVEDTFMLTVIQGSPPISSGFGATTPQNQPLLIPFASLLQPIHDPDGDAVHIVSVGDVPIFLNGQPFATVELSTNGALVVSDHARATYIPNQDFVGADRFSYVVGDSSGATNTVYAQIAVLPPGVRANAARSLVAGDGAISFGFAGLPGRTYEVQSAGSLAGPWLSVGTFIVAPDGSAFYRDPSPPDGNAFYRTALTP